MHLTNNQLVEKYHGYESFTFAAGELLSLPGKLKILQEINPVKSVILKLMLNKDDQMLFVVCQHGETVGRLKLPRSSYPLLLRAVWNAAKASPKSFAIR
ncbi:hypothetical protein [Pseudomonas sp. XWY-1]|uniref:hypothetical protein n=1 Tax=Pseudomonas sp. XWY-1 TaxID=2069256 RepID=UPI000CF442F7|nr:hypothetical protein [Pseudomonas sp. XWY-1]